MGRALGDCATAISLRVQHGEFGVMSGVRLKHPDALQNKRGGRYRPLKFAPRTERTIPPCPDGIDDVGRTVWETIWASRLADALGDTDKAALSRYVYYVSQWHQAAAQTELGGWPAKRALFRLEAAMRELEKHFGLDPLSRLRLGVPLADPYDPVAALKVEQIVEEYRNKLYKGGDE